jgi:hypothetical protein
LFSDEHGWPEQQEEIKSMLLLLVRGRGRALQKKKDINFRRKSLKKKLANNNNTANGMPSR